MVISDYQRGLALRWFRPDLKVAFNQYLESLGIPEFTKRTPENTERVIEETGRLGRGEIPLEDLTRFGLDTDTYRLLSDPVGLEAFFKNVYCPVGGLEHK